MSPDPHDAARLLGRILGLARRCGLLPDRGRSAIGGAVRNRMLDRLLERLARRLADSPTPEHRDVAAALAAAIGAHDHARALALVTTAGRRTDLRAEKMVSRRYRFLWLCNPKVASRSIIAALGAADPDAELFRDRTLDEVLARRPEARGTSPSPSSAIPSTGPVPAMPTSTPWRCASARRRAGSSSPGTG